MPFVVLASASIRWPSDTRHGFDLITARSVSFEVARFHQGWKPGISSAGGVSHRIARNTAFQA